jgi:hypothetical protein
MEKEHIHGKMEENIRVSINKIKKMGSALMYGQMEENILDNGKIVKGMEKVKSF